MSERPIEIGVSLAGSAVRFWCAACGCQHGHGAGGDAANPSLGNRGAHCSHDRSPFIGGSYDVSLAREPVEPTLPGFRRRGLGRVLDRRATQLQGVILDALVGAARRRADLGRSFDPLNLLSAAYGATAGVIVLMVIEAILAIRFDSQTVHKIVRAVDEWHAAGQPSRRGAV